MLLVDVFRAECHFDVTSQVYLQDEERLERRERVQLAELGRCSNNAGRGGHGQGEEEEKEKEKGGATGRRRRPAPAAAALGPCEDKTAEWEAAEKVGPSIGPPGRRCRSMNNIVHMGVACTSVDQQFLAVQCCRCRRKT